MRQCLTLILTVEVAVPEWWNHCPYVQRRHCVHQGQTHLFGEKYEIREAFLQGTPSVNICFSLASSGSAVLVSGCLGLSDMPCWLFLPLGPPFLLLSLETFLWKKKKTKIAHERGSLSICETEQLLERHMVSLSTRIHTHRQPGCRGICTDLMDRPFTGPLCPQLPVCSSTVATIPPHVSTSLKK